MNFGNALKSIIKSKGLSINEMADRTGISQQQLEDIIVNSAPLDNDLLKKIISALEVEKSVLILLAIEDTDIKPDRLDFFKELFPDLRDFVLSTLHPE